MRKYDLVVFVSKVTSWFIPVLHVVLVLPSRPVLLDYQWVQRVHGVQRVRAVHAVRFLREIQADHRYRVGLVHPGIQVRPRVRMNRADRVGRRIRRCLE